MLEIILWLLAISGAIFWMGIFIALGYIYLQENGS